MSDLNSIFWLKLDFQISTFLDSNRLNIYEYFYSRAHVVDESFPADHPYASHIPRTALLPNFDNPADPQKGPPGHMATHEAKAPAPTIVKMKTFGNDRRHEVQKDQMPSEKFPYQYQPNNINYYQVRDKIALFFRHTISQCSEAKYIQEEYVFMSAWYSKVRSSNPATVNWFAFSKRLK